MVTDRPNAAKAQASKKLKNWFMNEHEIFHSLETVANVFNDVNNHRVLELDPVQRRPRAKPLAGISDYFQFYFNTPQDHIYANLKATIDDNANADKIWSTNFQH